MPLRADRKPTAAERQMAMDRNLRTPTLFHPVFVLELPVAVFGIDEDVHAVDLLGQPLAEHTFLLVLQGHLLESEVVFVERGRMRRNHLHQLDDLAQLVAQQIFGQEGIRHLSRLETDQRIVVVEALEPAEVLLEELRDGQLGIEGLVALQNIVVRDDAPRSSSRPHRPRNGAPPSRT